MRKKALKGVAWVLALGVFAGIFSGCSALEGLKGQEKLLAESVSQEESTTPTEESVSQEESTVSVEESEQEETAVTEEKPEKPKEVRELSMEMVQMDGCNAVTFDSLPENTEEFAALAESALSTPENTCALFLCALKLFVEDTDAGVEALNILKGPQPMSTYDINWYKDRLRDKKYLYNVYFEGATPENSYTPEEPMTVKFYPNPRPQDLEKGYMKLGVLTPAFDSPRYITLRQKGEDWYIWEISSIMLGVRTPANEDPWS